MPAGNREAIDRGDLPADTDIDLLIDLLVAPVSYRSLVTGAPIPGGFAEQVVDRIYPAGATE